MQQMMRYLCRHSWVLVLLTCDTRQEYDFDYDDDDEAGMADETGDVENQYYKAKCKACSLRLIIPDDTYSIERG